MISSQNSDAELWRSFKEGDRESFATIYYQYFKNLYEYELRIVDDKKKLWSNKGNLTIKRSNKNRPVHRVKSLRKV